MSGLPDDGEVPDQPPADLDPAMLTEAARQLRAIVEALSATTARDRATARRIQGAALALETLAQEAPVVFPSDQKP